jgi:hypothetical protein
MFALLDLCSRLPQKIWYEADPKAHDQRHWETIWAALTAGMLLVLDAGYTNFGRFLQLSQATVTWITRAKSNLAYEVERCLVHTDRVQDALVWIGQGAERQRVRLVQILVRGQWYRGSVCHGEATAGAGLLLGGQPSWHRETETQTGLRSTALDPLDGSREGLTCEV